MLRIHCAVYAAGDYRSSWKGNVINLVFAGVALFYGGGLQWWAADGEAAWQLSGGVLEATGAGQGFLVSDAEYADFHLQLEFWVDATTNSGVFIRCRDRNRIHPDSCLELNIWDEHPRQEARTGAIVFRAMPPLAHVETVGRWNTLQVVARGTRIEVRINGSLTAQLEDAETTGGFIALQHWETGVVKFRNLVLTSLEK